MNHRTIGERIKALRIEKNETQEELGRKVILSQNSISKMENGETEIKAEHLCRFAEHFNVTIDYLCLGKDKNSLLNLLDEYIALSYVRAHDDEGYVIYPVITFNQAFLDYLTHSATAKSTINIPDDIRNLWVEREKTNFFEKSQKTKSVQSDDFILIPTQLISPYIQKKEARISDILKDSNNYFHGHRIDD